MCTVKDHCVCQHNNVCKWKVNVEVADEITAYVIFNILILELVLSNIYALIYLSILQATNSSCLEFHDQGISGKRIKCYQKTPCFASHHSDIQLNGDQPQDTQSVIICVILIFTMLVSVICSNFESTDVQATVVSVTCSLKGAMGLVNEDFEKSPSTKISNMINSLIPGKATQVPSPCTCLIPYTLISVCVCVSLCMDMLYIQELKHIQDICLKSIIQNQIWNPLEK